MKNEQQLVEIGTGVASIGSYSWNLKVNNNDGRMDPNKKKHPKDKALEGRYANTFEIGHNAVEFLFDFGQYHPENGERYFMRVITCPKYAKELLKVLQCAIDVYESKFGVIEDEAD